MGVGIGGSPAELHPRRCKIVLSAACEAAEVYEGILQSTRARRNDEQKFFELYENYLRLKEDVTLSAQRKRLFACTWADMHKGVACGKLWSKELGSQKPDYALGRESPVVLLELKGPDGRGITSKENAGESLGRELLFTQGSAMTFPNLWCSCRE